MISILAPARGATNRVPPDPQARTISILAPARGATSFGSKAQWRRKYFNPRSREGSDEVSTVGFDLYLDISILAPARGATGKESGN